MASGARPVVLMILDGWGIGDGGPGDRTFGGGHPWRAYMERMRGAPFALERNEDITRQVSPNVELVNQLLEQRLRPATATPSGAPGWWPTRAARPAMTAIWAAASSCALVDAASRAMIWPPAS